MGFTERIYKEEYREYSINQLIERIETMAQKEEHCKQVDPDARAVLRQFNLALSKITQREEVIKKQNEKLNALRASVDEYETIQAEVKELKKLNSADKEFVLKAIDFYESVTGEAVGVGQLFADERKAS